MAQPPNLPCVFLETLTLIPSPTLPRQPSRHIWRVRREKWPLISLAACEVHKRARAGRRGAGGNQCATREGYPHLREASKASQLVPSFLLAGMCAQGRFAKEVSGRQTCSRYPLFKEAAFLLVCFLSQLGCSVFLSCNTCFYLFLFMYFSFKISFKFKSVNIECGVSFWGRI